jgi:hypothetical protein
MIKPKDMVINVLCVFIPIEFMEVARWHDTLGNVLNYKVSK